MQYKVKAMLEEKGIEDPVVLTSTYGDTGIYTVMGNVPKIRFFCQYNNDDLKEMKSEQAAIISEKKADIIFYYSKWPEVHPKYDNYAYMGYFEGVLNYSYGFYHYYMPETE